MNLYMWLVGNQYSGQYICCIAKDIASARDKLFNHEDFKFLKMDDAACQILRDCPSNIDYDLKNDCPNRYDHKDYPFHGILYNKPDFTIPCVENHIFTLDKEVAYV